MRDLKGKFPQNFLVRFRKDSKIIISAQQFFFDASNLCKEICKEFENICIISINANFFFSFFDEIIIPFDIFCILL